jgi:integrase
MKAAAKAGGEWKRLFTIGIYTGLRLGDCCCLAWNSVNLERGVIQLVPTKTRKHAHGQPVTIPIHPQLHAELEAALARDHERRACAAAAFVNPTLADWYKNSKWRISHGLELIFKAAHIETSVKIEGRRTRTPEATFHSLRHTFVSLAANAGVPLPVVQSIVGHSSTAMTRHYYHENEEMLRQAVAAIPSLDDLKGSKSGSKPSNSILQPPRSAQTVEQRLRQLEKLKRKSLISEEEYASTRSRILAEI